MTVRVIVVRQRMRPSYRSADERGTEQMVPVLGGLNTCSTVATVYAKVAAKSPLFDLSLLSDRSLAQQKAKSKSEVTQCRNTLLHILATLKGIPTLIAYNVAVATANDCGRQHCRLSSRTNN